MIKTPKQQTLTMETKYISFYFIKVPCSTMIQWYLFLPFLSQDIPPQKNNPMFYSNSNGDKNYVI